jgi:membrane associated rhomboid family serine protease
VVPARPPRVTQAIVAATTIAFLAQMFLGGPNVELQGGFIPVRAIANVVPNAVPFWLTPITATLLHGGILHIALNLMMFIICGRQVESVLGGGRLALLYLAGAYGAASAQYLIDPTSPVPMIGASGAISAVLGTYALMFGRGKVRAIGPLSAFAVRGIWLAIAWTAIQWAISFASQAGPFGVATAAHVGGFLTGLILTPAFLEWRYRRG